MFQRESRWEWKQQMCRKKLIKTYPDIECDSFIGNDAISMWPSSCWFTTERFAAIAATVRSIHTWWLLIFSGIVCKITTKTTLKSLFLYLSLSSLSFSLNIWVYCLVFEISLSHISIDIRMTNVMCTNGHTQEVHFNWKTGSYLHSQVVVIILHAPRYRTSPYRIYAFQHIGFLFFSLFFLFGFCINRFIAFGFAYTLLKLNHTKFHVFEPK